MDGHLQSHTLMMARLIFPKLIKKLFVCPL